MASKVDNYLAMILRRRSTPDKVVGDEAIDEADSTVVAKLKALGEFTDRDMVAPRKTFDSKQRLVVLRRDSGGRRGSFAEVQKATERVAEGSE